MSIDLNKHLTKFGIDFTRSGAHTSRTLMLKELNSVFSYFDTPAVSKTDYLNAIINDNCLNKRTLSNRKITHRDLVKLYTLDPASVIFRTMAFFWSRDFEARPLLALLCAYCRDPLIRGTTPFILNLTQSSVVDRDQLQEYIYSLSPDRFSPATLKSVTQNLNASWTQSGHLSGRVHKRRVKALVTPANTAYALFLGYLLGERGESLLQSELVKLLDCSTDRTIELAEEASRRGWIVFKRVGKTIEVVFPNLLTQQEMEWLREQS